ncbi:uncharacterized protein BO95DRAFT_497984 [Aspergillus brunneoviolaceus CBS 621.78]|uniref:Uncharacterized protein n=1 Tax=Aspergillus brunneoviolaceus CBS 621.78 TaxID=1450534 RepID=A0ACD1GMU4_9EURO|nr:hypothetical protein BO95DRAFT_497984 [Aspergillus brunneoviolaceus CBS 621.78]RAH50570.1 hypothetical protein BO95DRAFT_497984 [Aspergillus brunneoviolaceus CBS 621.78]
MFQAPGAADLEGVEQKVTAILTALGFLVQSEKLQQPDVDKAMQHLLQRRIVHFACHGVADPLYPADSGLLLKQPPPPIATPQQQVLTATRLCISWLARRCKPGLRAPGPQDEHLPVVSRFQVAGFRHLIGCLWPSDNANWIESACSFYTHLHRGGMQGLTDQKIELALYKAVKAISEHQKYKRQPWN